MALLTFQSTFADGHGAGVHEAQGAILAFVIESDGSGDAMAAWHLEHERRPHDASTAALSREQDSRTAGDRELETRLYALELAVEGLRVRVEASRHRR